MNNSPIIYGLLPALLIIYVLFFHPPPCQDSVFGEVISCISALYSGHEEMSAAHYIAGKKGFAKQFTLQQAFIL